LEKILSQNIKKYLTKLLLSSSLMFFLANPALSNEKTVILPFEVFSIRNSIKDYGEILTIGLEESLNLSGEIKVLGENQQEKVIKKLRLDNSEINKAENINKIGKYLGANRVISGVIEQAGDLFKATVKITEIKTGKNIFSQTFKEKSLALLQEKIITSCLNSAKVQITEDKKKYLKLAKPLIRKPEVMENYLKGRQNYYLNSFLGWEKAEKYFKKALADNTIDT